MAKKNLSFYEVFKPPEDSSDSRNDSPAEKSEETSAEKSPAAAEKPPLEKKPAAEETPVSEPAGERETPYRPPVSEGRQGENTAPSVHPEAPPEPPVSAPSSAEKSREQKAEPASEASPRPQQSVPPESPPEKDNDRESMPFPDKRTESRRSFLTIGVDTAIILAIICFFLLYFSYRTGFKSGYTARDREIEREKENSLVGTVKAKPLDEMADVKDLVKGKSEKPIAVPEKPGPSARKAPTAKTADSRYKYTVQIVTTTPKRSKALVRELRKKKFDAFTNRKGNVVYVGRFRSITEERAVEMRDYFRRLQVKNRRPYKSAYFVRIPQHIVY